MRGLKIVFYILSEIIPGFILGTLVFLFLLVMFQGLRLTEFVLIHNVSIQTIGRILLYQCISFLPVIMPMALLLSLLMGYGRLSSDSEVIAMKAAGLSMWSISLPSFVIGIVILIASAQTSFYLSPWGNRQFEVLISKFSSSKASIVIKEGTFSESFFDLVVYAGKVNTQTGELENIFLYDERNEQTPITIVAKSGQMIPDPEMPNQSVLLRLRDGDIHRQSLTHTKIKFDTYDIRLADTSQINIKEKSPQSLSITELSEKIQISSEKKEKVSFQVEFHKRIALSMACLIFSLIGIGLGASSNLRSQKSNGIILSFVVIMIYWILYVTFESIARSGKYPIPLVIWIPNIIFCIFAMRRLQKNWN